MLFNEKFYENNQPYNDILHVRQMGKVLEDATYHIERENSATVVIASILSGILHVEVDNNRYSLQTGHSILLPHHIKYEFYSDTKNPCQMLWINIRGPLIEHLYTGLFTHTPMVISNHNIEKDFNELKGLIKIKTNQQVKIQKLISHLMIDLHHFRTEAVASAPQKIKSEYEYYLSECVQNGFTLEAMSKHFHVSTDTLNRQFKKLYHMTPYQYYQKIRFDLAISLLSHTDLTIEDISSRLGFSNRNHFTNFFKKHHKLAPATFRKLEQV